MRCSALLLCLALAACDDEAPEAPEPPDTATAPPGASAPTAEPEPEQPPPVSLPEGDLSVLNPELREHVRTNVLPAVNAIPSDRRTQLDRLADFVRERSEGPAKLTFICTHNSRRSHMAQLWAAAAAAYHDLDSVETYSGGTEATAFNPRAVASLERAGFAIEAPTDGGTNPRYRVRFAEDGEPTVAFSKVFGDETNPQEGFVAIMTCSDADRSCPFVEGAALRLAIPYVDPKEADDTPEEAARYDERSLQIASEMFYVMGRAAG